MEGLAVFPDGVRQMGVRNYIPELNEVLLTAGTIINGSNVQSGTWAYSERAGGMVRILQQYGLERMLVNSAADWGRSDPLLTAKTGVAMVEYRYDPASRRYVFMEINGRFWGSLQLAIDAGVDFPALLVAATAAALAQSPASTRLPTRVPASWLFPRPTSPDTPNTSGDFDRATATRTLPRSCTAG